MAERDLTILTAASENHGRALLNLLFSLDRYEPGTRVIVYDLGLSDRTRAILHRQHRTLIPFPFDDYPAHIANDRLGTYAWKPVMVYETLRQGAAPLLYLDAGNLLHEKLTRVRVEIARAGFYSPFSVGTITDWCHPAALEAMKVEPEIHDDINRNAAVIGFGAGTLARDIADRWNEYALRAECICPPGATRKDHRFDQSALSVITSRARRAYGITLCDTLLGITVHNDNLSFAAASAAIKKPAELHRIERRRPRPVPPPKRQPTRLHRLWRRMKKLWRRAAA